MFHRKTGIKKTKSKQISKDMISPPQLNFVHMYHLEMKSQHIEVESNPTEPTLSLLDDVMQAFAEIYNETEIDPDATLVEIDNPSASLSQLLSKLAVQRSPETSPRLPHEFKERSRNDLSLNRDTSKSYSSISSNPQKSGSYSHCSSISSLNSRSSSITGQPLPPPPDLSSLGNKLTTASSTQNIQLLDSLKSTKSRRKKRFHFFT